MCIYSYSITDTYIHSYLIDLICIFYHTRFIVYIFFLQFLSNTCCIYPFDLHSQTSSNSLEFVVRKSSNLINSISIVKSSNNFLSNTCCIYPFNLHSQKSSNSLEFVVRKSSNLINSISVVKSSNLE